MAPYDLAARTLELVNTPSESWHEAELAALVERLVPFDPRYAQDETLLFAPDRSGVPLVVFAGHLDTVPANGNLPGTFADGRVIGLGASDMKGGLAVMIELARWIAQERPTLACDPAFLFFPREEIGIEHSPLPTLFETGLVDDAALVVVLEPTDNTLQVGCVGSITAVARFEGRSAHAARPWLGVNAIGLAVDALAPIIALEPLEVEIDGLVFREVLTPTRIAGGQADNVVPDLVEVSLNFRYGPHRSRDEAENELRSLVPGRLDVTSHSPGAKVAIRNPLVQRLRTLGNFAVEPKQAWTPVAQFAERGLDAINLGPGATRFAHARDEQVEAAALIRCFDALRSFLSA